ncbi:MAG: radical SAM protein [Anaerolineaceae bacterium]|nr:radical SAM protein [Anaerolineaceae bacterium]
MKYIYGPVPSRRLGQSLGIDTIPLKTCNWNCVYCQLGRTVPLTNERKIYFPTEEILDEVQTVLANHAPGDIDWVTFVGSGEPTLHSGLGWLIQQVKQLTDLPIAVITNGALLYLPDVRRDLAQADAVMPSLDAGTAVLYRQLNRPHPEVTFTRLVDGLEAFRQGYSGQLWIEVMLMQGLNDSESALRDIAAVLRRIRPDEVHLNLPTRPPAETWVRPSDEEGLLRARAILGDVATVVHPVEGSFDLSGFETAVEAIISIITRHPMRQEELERTLDRWAPGRVQTALAELEASGQAQVIERYGIRFWSAAGSRYPDEVQSQAANAPGRAHQRRSTQN